ncbi:MAG: hypothetical protein QM759_00880 [Terricaulis sp.]
MARQETTTDPYAPPPLKKDKGGALVRGAILVGLLAVGGAVAYTVMQTPAPQTASLEDQNSQQQLADGSYAANPGPQVAPPPEAAPAPAATPAPSAPGAAAPHRSAAPRQTAPVEDPTPAAETAPAPVTPTPPAPLPPDVTPPSASGQ